MTEYRAEEAFLHALDLIHCYVDASDEELADEGITREEVLERAREARDIMDPVLEREDRWNRTNGFHPSQLHSQ